MDRHKGNKTRVAEELGLTRVGLRMKLARLGLDGGGE
jgi:DNA-binding protein Fis